MASNLLATLIGLLSLLGVVPSASVPGADAAAAPAPARPAVLERPDAELVDEAAASTELATVGTVDVDRYLGLWHELARLPVRFQDPTSVSTARYTQRRDGLVGVENTAYVGATETYQLRGTAEPVDPARADKLRVRFGGFLAFVDVPEEGNYWIVDLADDYSLALVGTPDRQFLWLLARDPKDFDVDEAQAMLDRAATLGFDTSELAIADWDRRVIRE